MISLPHENGRPVPTANAPGGFAGCTVAGPPSASAQPGYQGFARGEWVTDQAGVRWTCTGPDDAGNNPGTWVQEPGTRSVTNAVPATTPGAVVAKIQIFDASGTSLGYVAVYSSIA